MQHATESWFHEQITRWLPELPLSLVQAGILFAHFERLQLWNGRINLTAIRDPEEMVKTLYCESLFFAEALEQEKERDKIADLGSGAGFPGVPVAVWLPGSKMALVEAHQRKAVFLKESTRGMDNIEVLSLRGELMQNCFDWVISRAVSPLVVVRLGQKLAPRIGLMTAENELSALRNGDGGVEWTKLKRIPWAERKVCLFGKFNVPRETVIR